MIKGKTQKYQRRFIFNFHPIAIYYNKSNIFSMCQTKEPWTEWFMENTYDIISLQHFTITFSKIFF